MVTLGPNWRVRMTSGDKASEAPGARLNDTVVDGNWPRWLISSGEAPSVILTTVSSGTWPLATAACVAPMVTPGVAPCGVPPALCVPPGVEAPPCGVCAT